MSYPKPRVLLITLAVILVAGVGGYIAFQKSSESSEPATQTTKQAKTNPKVVNPSVIQTASFTYQKPAGWAKLAPDTLQLSGSSSGIGRATKPAAQFTIKVSPSVPASTEELKKSVLQELGSLSAFKLVDSGTVKIGNSSGQKFTYTFTGDDKVALKQEVRVIPHKQKTFFLLFSSTESDFDKLQPDFTDILSTFRFK